MACVGLVANNMNLKPGSAFECRASLDAKGFMLNLGTDGNSLCLHFHPHFKIHRGINKIVCNSKNAGAQRKEYRESVFPFQPGSVTEVCIAFDKAEQTIKLPDGYTFKFPNCLNLETINYMGAEGNFKVKCVTFE